MVKDKPLKIKANVLLNLKNKEVKDKINNATEQSIKNVVVAIANDAIKLSPKLTGNNARSIRYEVGPNGEVAKRRLEGAVYSTSGYGGFL